MMRMGISRRSVAQVAKSSWRGASSRSVSDWCSKTLLTASKALVSGDVSAVELTQACIDQVEKTRAFNMFVSTDFERALQLAKASDERRAAGQSLGLLDGIPVGVKDLFCMENVPTTASSKILENFVSPYESTATQRLLDQGAVPLGKLNMDEFAMGSGTLYSKFGATINPWSKDLGDKAVVAGGSSGGSAAAVASGCCFAALGSDTGGSVRQPAAYCGIVGLKPSYGRVSRHGMISYASSLDTPGIFARSVGDATVVLKAIAGPDHMDSTCMTDALPENWCSNTVEVSQQPQQVDLTGVRVGVPAEYFVQELPEEILNVWDKGVAWLRDAGAQVVSVSLPTTKLCIPAYYILACAEASSNLSRYDGVRYGYRAKDIVLETQEDQSDALHDLYCRTRSEGFGEEVQRRILSGTFVLSAGAMSDYYERGVILRQRIRRDFQRVFEEQGIDVLLTPTTPSGPFPVENKQAKEDPVSMYLNDVMTVPANMAGVPAISVPAALTSEGDYPLGLQLMGARKTEERLLQVANALEQRASFGGLVPARVYATER
ncbi:Glutamyl-tRNA(Gln) amidotransferase subunit A [Phytophthora cactorum]|uniref:Glutamyl-tRNA(Gln) amidotransferase subunit A, mitochondrial n=2 Tax=Phytophthora cactorum TaxID=29920 RepID=A0A8T0ZPN5_9STRA|nr:Glutamyl-tRNA(Gln) amidotransferase subunit A [Phytophthora cactorum]KAG2840304.1 Glutamyl-tRNA(Gln) amidotransferase subunit A [Phytophthora cactorum]KAG2864569.1 Glutamyl-tRNA(Gln) amidotransferase subunit A [Phytophthora cactorum]KAG2937613.1 Glutamyl-tRNA(Gln) amidotransferase subunit A [Phytophthora cactorum]KAG2993676.1 Glutamyl-tRNA(Gln) amidotransferase subunit A [Phytophthora cactorum]